ncbi:hypothetical protein Glove_88g32 [Diversispora epigaea]|uniref:Protein kinase domain-containing protein n=1 Tax=Diversispora epigaea TaxID=1348612 RepID=A0A397JEU7_9GLOM|nr:hypothetical protein Glove_88g32 [Diversispora epigaea]
MALIILKNLIKYKKCEILFYNQVNFFHTRNYLTFTSPLFNKSIKSNKASISKLIKPGNIYFKQESTTTFDYDKNNKDDKNNDNTHKDNDNNNNDNINNFISNNNKDNDDINNVSRNNNNNVSNKDKDKDKNSNKPKTSQEIAQELYEKQKNFYRDNYVEKNNYELLENFPEWLDGIGLKLLAPYFENMRWQEVMLLSTRNLIDMGIKNSNITSLLIRHFWRSKIIHIKSKGLILTQIQLSYRDRDFQMIGRDLAVDPYLLKDLKFCLNAIGYAYSNFAPFFYGKTWQEIIDMNIYNLWELGINDRKQRNIMVDSIKKFKKAMIHTDFEVALLYDDKDFQMIGRDLAVDPYLLKGIILQCNLKFCLNAIGYAYSNFAPFFYGKTWQEIIDMNIYNLWELGINDRKQRNIMVDSIKKFKKAMIHTDFEVALLYDDKNGIAFQWYLKSAEGGNITGQFNLGHSKGGNKEKNILKSAEGEIVMDRIDFEIIILQNGIAFQWYLKSAEGGNITGQFNLGHSKGGNKESQCFIEYLYRNEIGISKIKKNETKLIQDVKNEDIEKMVAVKPVLSNLSKWISGNNEIDKIIHISQLDENAKEWEIWRWIDYNKFKNIEYLAEEGFSSIWKAEWIDMPEELLGFYNSSQVALKKPRDSQQISSEFLREVCFINYGYNTRLKDKRICNSFTIYERWKFDKLSSDIAFWKERLWLLNSFIRGLKTIHSKGFIHCDLHPGNLTITEAHDNSKFIRFCRPVNEITFGRCDILNKNPYTQASDIYKLAVAIFNGHRPKINEETPQCYVELMEKCWRNDPSKRPSAEEIFNILELWIQELMYFSYLEKPENALMFLSADQEMQNVD